MNAINIVTFFDESFLFQAAILAASLARTAAPERPLRFHAFCRGGSQKRFVGLVEHLSSASFSVICEEIANPFDPSIPAAYVNDVYCARFCLGDLLDCDRVLYLDSDILVRRSLAELYDTELGDKIIAAVPDNFLNTPDSQIIFSSGCRSTADDYRRHIGVRKNLYFNSGVMLIDLKKWRTAKVKERCLDFLRECPALVFIDQDALNFVLGDRVAIVGNEWNFIECNGPSRPPRCAGGPAIVHFAGPQKPWLPNGASSEFHAEYWANAVSTPYGASLVDAFFQNAVGESEKFKARLAASAAIIPARFRPFEVGWTKHLPSVLLQQVAAACCTFGKGRMLRTGMMMWNFLKARQYIRAA